MKFTVWGRELQWRTSGRESTSFPTVSIEIPGKEEKKKTCISLMTGNSMASAAAALSLSKNSLSLFLSICEHLDKISKVGLMHEFAIRRIVSSDRRTGKWLGLN